jgi:hypothetical protein
LPPGAARVVQRQLEYQLRGGRHTQFAAAERRHHVEVLLHRLHDAVRIEFDVAHHLGEHVPLDLRERQEDMLIRQQRMLASTRFFGRAIDDPLRGVPNFARRDVKIVNVHVAPPIGLDSKTYASGIVAAWPHASRTFPYARRPIVRQLTIDCEALTA